ncbi:MAG: hypothetical protein HY298_09775 [Verrucomicrobia bacterium]|nr:hypothetical protein [Verrucomicrobiota bacterium]
MKTITTFQPVGNDYSDARGFGVHAVFVVARPKDRRRGKASGKSAMKHTTHRNP